MKHFPDHLNTEGLVKAHMRKLVKLYHPDIPVTGDPVKFREIFNEYTTLKLNGWNPKSKTVTAEVEQEGDGLTFDFDLSDLMNGFVEIKIGGGTFEAAKKQVEDFFNHINSTHEKKV